MLIALFNIVGHTKCQIEDRYSLPRLSYLHVLIYSSNKWSMTNLSFSNQVNLFAMYALERKWNEYFLRARYSFFPLIATLLPNSSKNQSFLTFIRQPVGVEGYTTEGCAFLIRDNWRESRSGGVFSHPNVTAEYCFRMLFLALVPVSGYYI